MPGNRAGADGTADCRFVTKSRGQQREQGLSSVAGDAGDVEVAGGVSAGGGAEGLAEGGVVQEYFEFFDEFRGFGWIEEQPVSIFLDHFGYASEPGGEDGEAACHVVGQGAGDVKIVGFGANAHGQADVSGIERAVDVGEGGEPTRKGDHIRQMELAGEAPEARHVRAVANEKIMQLRRAWTELRQRAQDPFVAFVGMQDAMKDEDDLVWGEAEAVARLQALVGGEGAVEGEVAGVVHGVDAVGVDAVPGEPGLRGFDAGEDEGEAAPGPEVDGADGAPEEGERTGEIDVGEEIGDGHGDIWTVEDARDEGGERDCFINKNDIEAPDAAPKGKPGEQENPYNAFKEFIAVVGAPDAEREPVQGGVL